MTGCARVGAGVAAALASAALGPGAAGAAAPPRIEQLVVFRDGQADQAAVTAARATARVGGRRCAVGAGTPLAALLRSGTRGIGLRDYGSCSKRAADAGGLYVWRIRRDRARGANGWVYKVANRAATAGAGDPTGPFGRGRLRPGARVTWFYCRMRAGGCQRTLAVRPEALGGGELRVTVRAYDDRGRGRPAAGATVRAGADSAIADSRGIATLTRAPGTVELFAEAKGAVRSFTERVDVR